MAFMPGFYAFPGGQRDDADAQVEVDDAADRETATIIACAARELFEELGVLAARGADSLTKGQLASVLDDLTSARMTFAELLAHYGLHLDARDFQFAGRWVTPPFSPRRFDTLFFVVKCPRKQEPRVLTTEFDTGEWTGATTTNCYVVGTRDFLVVDPGSPYEDEQAALAGFVKGLISQGRAPREIVLTHQHPDHVGGVEHLRATLGGDVKVAAHRLTAEALRGVVRVDRLIEDGDTIEL